MHPLLRYFCPHRHFHFKRNNAFHIRVPFGEQIQTKSRFSEEGKRLLVFIEHYMFDFAEQKKDYSEEKWIGIIQKTWNKLSPKAQNFVLQGQIKLPQTLEPLILKAIHLD